jgi:hypothetical protein
VTGLKICDLHALQVVVCLPWQYLPFPGGGEYNESSHQTSQFEPENYL